MENAMWNAKPSPRPITSARSAEEFDSCAPNAIIWYSDSDWVYDMITRKSVDGSTQLCDGRVVVDYVKPGTTLRRSGTGALNLNHVMEYTLLMATMEIDLYTDP
eukprot:8061192-Heterocapsa_arctica.AAC.1